jgi:hypothetical protein
MKVFFAPQEGKAFQYQVYDGSVPYVVDLSSGTPTCTCLRLQVCSHTIVERKWAVII